jgi:uncharacterized membrane protein YkoI
MNRTIIGAALAGTALLAASACAGDARQLAAHQAPSPMPSPMSPSDTPMSPSGSPSASGMEELKQAGQAALKAVPGSTLTSIESEENDKLWEVQVVDADGTEHELDVESGKVVSGPSAEDDDTEEKAEYQERVKAAKLDYLQAAQKVAGAVPEGRITELNLDTHNGKTVWEADVITANGTKQGVTVDAADGTTTKDPGQS